MSMASEEETQSPSSKYSIPPPWYQLQTSQSGQPYIHLSASDSPPIFLTTFHITDAEALHKVLSIPCINDKLISIPKPYNLSDAHFWINLQLSGTSALPLQALRAHDPKSGTFIGAASLTPSTAPTFVILDHDVIERRPLEYELGYYLHPEFRRRGIMRDAVLALLAWAMAQTRVNDVIVKVAVQNTGSRKLVESLEGFVREDGEGELVWPEGKGGGRQRTWSWRWRCMKI